jgi:hypothetical protein
LSKSDKHFDVLSVLAGHKRYAHITGLRNDGVLPELLGMTKIVSEDAVRRGFKAIGADEGRDWLQAHLDYCTAPLLAEPWILDADSTVKPLYGHQEGAILLAAIRQASRRGRWLQSQEAGTSQPFAGACRPREHCLSLSYLHHSRFAAGAGCGSLAGQ